MNKSWWALWYVVISVFVVGLVVGNSKCYADDKLWVSSIARSYHLDRQANYHESNLGLGLEIEMPEHTKLLAGFYSNSFNRPTRYAGVAWLPVDLGNHIRFGGVAVVMTGYQFPVVVAGAPALVWEYKNVGINFLSIGVVSEIQFKVGF